MKQFAMIGKWHVHAKGYAKEINETPDCRVKYVWDSDESIAAAWAEELACETATVDEILSDPQIEGVIICAATNEHGPLLLKACAAGKAVFCEKLLTLTVKEAEAVREAVIKNNTHFAISFPHYSEPGTQFALQAARSGKLGKINYARVRKAHNGSLADWLPPHFYDPVACGGGAMIDLGAHPMYLLCAFLGEPKAVKSFFTSVTDRAVEDNAVSVLSFDDGAIGVSETGFVSVGYPFTIELGGTESTLMVRGKEDVSWCLEGMGKEWQKVEDLPAALPSPIKRWAMGEKTPALYDIDAAVQLTRVMEMAYAAK